ncbi:MAG: hypothetical protein KDE26_05065 [Bacteroidetes bacterium]|nr:hypothetical protein [Bacteroidota bacterium]
MTTRVQKLSKYTAGEHINYILNLRRKKRRQERRVRIADAMAARIERIQTALEAKRDYLDQYWKKIEKTNNLGKDVIQTLERNTPILERAADNVSLTNDAVQILVINAERSAYETEDLVKAISDLLYDISCMAQQPNPNGPIMKALNELAEATRGAMNEGLNGIDLTGEVYQRAEALKAQVGDKHGKYGLTRSYKGLDRKINIKYDRDSKIRFPREGCPDDLWDQTKKAYDRVTNRIDKLQEELNQILEKKKLAQARMDAISTSLVAAEAAAKC